MIYLSAYDVFRNIKGHNEVGTPKAPIKYAKDISYCEVCAYLLLLLLYSHMGHTLLYLALTVLHATFR